jgi:hypothetical protein
VETNALSSVEAGPLADRRYPQRTGVLIAANSR